MLKGIELIETIRQERNSRWKNTCKKMWLCNCSKEWKRENLINFFLRSNLNCKGNHRL